MDPYQHAQEARYQAIDAVIDKTGEFAHGGREGVAQTWLEHGFTADEVQEWLDARCFDADVAAELKTAGYTPAQASERTDAGFGEYTDTIGYKASNGDLTAGDLI